MKAPASLAEADVVVFDTEFHSKPGCHPEPLCLVARSVRTQRTLRMAGTELHNRDSLHDVFGPDAIYMAFQAEEEIACLLQLGWFLPKRLLDLRVEAMVILNTPGKPCVFPDLGPMRSLGALLRIFTGVGLDGMRKVVMQSLAMRGGPFSPHEIKSLLDYCESDVTETERLFRALAPDISLPHALIRGEYIKTVATMERTGIPVDRPGLDCLAHSATHVRPYLTAQRKGASAFYDGDHFREERFSLWLGAHGIPWRRTPRGKLVLQDEYLKEQAMLHPVLEELHQLRKSFASLQAATIPVGPDGRNRTGLRPFASITGRNQPSSNAFLFGRPRWWRGFITPEPGRALALLDFSQQEFGIAAALSGDTRMQEAYLSGDPYLAFGQQIGLIPADGTPTTHRDQRNLCKTVLLGVQYGMGAPALAMRLGWSQVQAEEMLRLHRRTYPRFWKYLDEVENFAALNGRLHTTFDWRLRAGATTKTGTLHNFPMQANGAEILRFSSVLMHQNGIRVCAPVHDAFLIEAPMDEIDHATTQAQSLMREASAMVLEGFQIRSAEECRLLPGQRMLDAKSAPMWNLVQAILSTLASGVAIKCARPTKDTTSSPVVS